MTLALLIFFLVALPWAIPHLQKSGRWILRVLFFLTLMYWDYMIWVRNHHHTIGKGRVTYERRR